MRFPEGRVEGVGPLGSPTAMALQVAVDEHALEFRPAEYVEAVRSVRLESNEHADEVAGCGVVGCPIVCAPAVQRTSTNVRMSNCHEGPAIALTWTSAVCPRPPVATIS